MTTQVSADLAHWLIAELAFTVRRTACHAVGPPANAVILRVRPFNPESLHFHEVFKAE